MEAACNKDSLSFQGHRYQVFHDLFQLTLTKRKAMKPHFLILQHCLSLEFPLCQSLLPQRNLLYVQISRRPHHNAPRPLSTPETSTEGSKCRVTSCSPKKLQDSPQHQAYSSIHKGVALPHQPQRTRWTDSSLQGDIILPYPPAPLKLAHIANPWAMPPNSNSSQFLWGGS